MGLVGKKERRRSNMGRLTEDMTRLSGEIGLLHSSREAFIDDLNRNMAEMKAHVAEIQAGFREAHDEMARRTRGDRMAFESELKANVAEMRGNFRDTHSEMAKDTKAERGAFISGVKRAVVDSRKAASEMQAGFREAHDEMARRTRGDRMAFESELKANVAEMRGNFRDDRAKKNAETKADLLVFVSGLKEFAAGLNKTVAGLRQELAEDISGARRAWSGPSPVERRIRPKAEPQQEEPELRAKEEKRLRRPEAKPAVIVPDDLTTIQGIGPGMQERLKEAGIYSFAVLARSTPDELRRALGRLARLADVDRWIEEARELG
jgi:predicted flap endonuclease-1-like 5' DNA nuclease